MPRTIYVFERDRDAPRRLYSRQRVATDAWNATAASLGRAGWELEELTSESADEPMIAATAPYGAEIDSACASFETELRKRGIRVKQILRPN